MTREFSDELLSAYLDDQLAAEERSAVETQLAASPEHRQLLDELRTLSGQVRSLPRIKADEHFADRVVQAAVAAQGRSAAAAPLARGNAQGGYWSYALAAVAATAACVALIVWMQNNPAVGPGENKIVTVPPKPGESSNLEQALERLRASAPAEGEAIVLKIRVGQGLAPHQVLDAVLADAGIVHRDPSDTSTQAFAVGGEYRRQVPKEAATHAAEDAIYLDAPWSKLEAAVASLTELNPGQVDIQALVKVTPPKSVDGGERPDAEHPGIVAPPLSTESFAQRLPARIYKLENEPATAANSVPASPRQIDGQKRVRVLILVERDAQAN